MIEITLDKIPNQEFSITLDEDIYNITIKEANGIMAADIVRNNETLILGVRLLANTVLLPYKYQEKGNFVMITNNDDLPYYTEFGTSQSLFYVNMDELGVLRAGA